METSAQVLEQEKRYCMAEYPLKIKQQSAKKAAAVVVFVLKNVVFLLSDARFSRTLTLILLLPLLLLVHSAGISASFLPVLCAGVERE
jgi:hypothetical protein